MPGFGAQLRRERERRGFTLEQIADTTRINPRYLKALETDDLSKLPGSVFNKGYVRAYAVAIGADPDPLIEAYSGEERAQQDAGKLERPDAMDDLAQVARRRPGGGATDGEGGLPRWTLPLVGAVLLALIAWGAVRLFSGGPEDEGSTLEARAGSDPSDVERPAPAESLPADDSSSSGDQEEPAAAGPPERDLESPPAESPAARATPTSPLAAEERPDPEPREREPAPARPEPSTSSGRASASTTPATRSAAAPAASEPPPGPITISEYGVGTGVVNRALVGQTSRFAPGTRVWFWNRVLGGSKGDHIRHVWIFDGKTISSTRLELGGPHWRTQSRKTMRKEGRWAVEARDAAGHVLARSEFVCGPADG
jgi:cytoskeletal protein RodZ